MTAKEIQKFDKYTVPQLLKKCQVVFNAYIRKRDKDKGCISCSGEVQQAGHYLSQGHHSALRFDENNTNGQCIKCNLYLSGNLINYRKGLVKRIGEEKVSALEDTPKKAHKWDRLTLIEKIIHYKNKTKCKS